MIRFFNKLYGSWMEYDPITKIAYGPEMPIGAFIIRSRKINALIEQGKTLDQVEKELSNEN